MFIIFNTILITSHLYQIFIGLLIYIVLLFSLIKLNLCFLININYFNFFKKINLNKFNNINVFLWKPIFKKNMYMAYLSELIFWKY